MNVRRGDVIEVDVDRVGNGGVCIGRYEGIVVLIRLALPGERVRARVTDVSKRMLRADVIEVTRASPDRVEPPCRYFGSCGGCDWQHAAPDAQRALKAAVVIEQMSHLGGVRRIGDRSLDTFQVDAMSSGGMERWRTRNRFHRVGDSAVGLYAARSKDVVTIDDCMIAAAGSTAAAREALAVVAGDISTVSGPDGLVVVDPRGGPLVREVVGTRTWLLHASGFWQVHTSAAADLSACVVRLAAVRPGESVLDLYSGAGLFAGMITDAEPAVEQVVAVESGIDAVRDARRSLSDLARIELVTADVPRWVLDNADCAFDVIVVDPPRAGVGQATTALIAGMARRAIVYVACEPSSLARDTGILRDHGWELMELVGFDAFPMTSHVECIALFTRT